MCRGSIVSACATVEFALRLAARRFLKARASATRDTLRPAREVDPLSASFAAFASASNTTTEAAKNFGSVATNVFGKTGDAIGKTSGVAGNIMKDAGNVMENAGGMLNKFKGFSLRPSTPGKKAGSSQEKHEVEEVDFAKPPSMRSSSGEIGARTPPRTGASAAPPSDAFKNTLLDDADDLLAFLDDDVDAKTEKAKQEFDDLLVGDSTSNHDANDFFTIDDDDLL
jgi:hypothetical protein